MQSPRENWTLVTEFVLVGFTGIQEAWLPLFGFFLIMYLLTLMENGILVLAVATEKRLHTPMYFFLIHLSFLDIWYTSLTVPKMLAGFGYPAGQRISYSACLTQLYLFTFLGSTECFLLAAMAYDRYVAICIPLRYHEIVDQNTCLILAIGSWLAGFLTPVLPVYFMSQLTFCGPNVIDHFFCDASPLLILSCTDISLKESIDFLVSLLVLLISSLVIIISYVHIIITVLKINSLVGRQRAFSTCTAHLIVVAVFYGTLFFMYVRIKVTSSINLNKVVSVFYAVVTPVLNPLIYSLRNTEVKGVLYRIISEKKPVVM
ncbi:olfactory receptor 6Q1-like [Protobothrops mucrosquamatus]|uniref:olfactory receptor 6Q1-like n=1 Tax=Protobothrops mucrosquamatus TaxID=103944 RepID=UPI000775FF6B|nr:olfactory receptor 6Q1-like [Protobothrops mucrosquamatus]